MKILHINSYYYGSKLYKNLFDEQIKNGLDISVFVPVSKPINNESDFGTYTKISVNHSKYDRILFHLKHYKILADINRKYTISDYNVIHAHSLFSNGYVAMKLNEQYKIPYIVAVRNTDVNTFFRKMVHLRKMGINILRKAKQIVFLSESYRDQVLQNYVPNILRKDIYSKSSIIPNGIDDFWLRNIGSPKKKLMGSTLILLQVGDINKNKNIITTVKATNILIKKGYQIKLDVAGKVRDQEVFNSIKDLQFVNYLGYKSKEELLDIYRANDVFVLPSKNETFGLVYAEAMSQGLPVLYTRGQGFDRQFDDGLVGYSVDSNNENEIADRVIDIITNYEHISKNCVNLSSKFSWGKLSKI